jgi:hypothetical protein
MVGDASPVRVEGTLDVACDADSAESDRLDVTLG